MLRQFTRLKLRLMPYVWAAAVEAHERGTPLLRAMMLEFPDDPAVSHLDTQYLFGPSLLVAPVFDEGNSVRYYLPPGEWTDFFTSERVSGGRFIRETDVSMFRIPLFVRENTLLTVGAHEDRPDYDFLDGLTLELFALADGAEANAVVHGPTGVEQARFSATRTGGAIEVRGSGGRGLKLRLRQSANARVVDGGSVLETAQSGTLVAWPEPSKPLKLVLG